jgi:hypothetical protein
MTQGKHGILECKKTLQAKLVGLWAQLNGTVGGAITRFAGLSHPIVYVLPPPSMLRNYNPLQPSLTVNLIKKNIRI